MDAHGQQLNQVTEIVNNMPKQGPIFLAGDLNIRLNSGGYTTLKSWLSDFTDVFEGQTREQTHRNWNVVLDYMFANQQLLEQFTAKNHNRVDVEVVSDHFGLSVDLCTK